MDVDNLAVGYPADLFSHTSQLKPKFYSDEKESVWDGFVCVYRDRGPQHRAENLLRRVPAQIKGTQQKLVRDGDGVRFRLEVSSLNAYLTERPSIARDCCNLSFLYEEPNITDALRYAERALDILENAHNAEHNHTKLAKKQVERLKEAQP